MKFIATITKYLEIEADSEQEAYEEAREIVCGQPSADYDSIEIEPDD